MDSRAYTRSLRGISVDALSYTRGVVMRKMGLIGGMFLVITLTACGPFVHVDKVSPEEASRVQDKVKIYNNSQLFGKSFEVVNVIEGNSCKSKTWDKPASRPAAIEQLRFQAYRLGANGITNIQCHNREETSLSTNCWDLISCTAEAVKVSE
jgi:uncharacterized protein YbjQ (UPF0145 family)